MQNINPNTRLSYRLRGLGCALSLLVIFGISVYLMIQSNRDATLKMLLCETPWFVNPIAGKVQAIESGQPVQNARVIIRSASPPGLVCPDRVYLTELDLQTDSEGNFKYVSGEVANPDQDFNITISAANCKTYEGSNISFRVFMNSGSAIFPISCKP